MGMFTSIVHPVDGRELQIKCGYDDLRVYYIGDFVQQYPEPQNPGSGYLLDDVYSSYSDRGDDDWVVIKDGRIHAVVPREPVDYEEDEEGEESSQYTRLCALYQIEPPPEDWWTSEAWDRHNKEVARRQEESEKHRRRLDAMTPAERQDAILESLASVIRTPLGYTSVAREIFKVEPMSETNVPHYMPKDDKLLEIKLCG